MEGGVREHRSPQAFAAPRRGGLPRARGRGGRLAAGGRRRRRRDRARRGQRALTADPRGDRPATRSSGCRSTRPRRGAASPTPTVRWRKSTADVGRHPARHPPAALRTAGRRGGADAATAAIDPPRPAGDAAPARPSCPHGHEDALGGERPRRRVPGAGRTRAARLPAGGRWRAAASVVTDKIVAPLFAASSEAPRTPDRFSEHTRTSVGGSEGGGGVVETIEVEAGGDGQDPRQSTEKVLRALTREGMTRERPRGRARRRRRRRPRRALSPTSTSAASRSSRCRPRWSSQVDSAYGGKVGVDLPEGKNYAGAFQHARRGDRRLGGAGRRCRRMSLRPGSSRC